jgi:hypothetical protein
MDDDINVGEVADEVLRFDGPHHARQIVAAAALISELLRRINNATFPTEVFTYPSEVDKVVGRLEGAAAGLAQACRQLAAVLDAMADNPNLRSDTDQDIGAAVATDAARALREYASAAAVRLAAALSAAHDRTSTLRRRD